jgi:hypothetical protein
MTQATNGAMIIIHARFLPIAIGMAFEKQLLPYEIEPVLTAVRA